MVKAVQNLSATTNISAGVVSPPDVTISRIDYVVDATVVAGSNFYESTTIDSTSAGAWYEYTIDPQLGKTVDLLSLNPLVCEIIGNKVSKVGSGGIARVRISQGNKATLFTASVASGQKTVNSWSGYQTGSLSKLLADNVLNRITAGKTRTFFTDYSNSLRTSYTLDPNCWLANVNLSGCPVLTTIFGSYSSANRGALITNQHVLGALHYINNTGYSVGSKIQCCGTDGIVYERTVIGVGKGIGDIVVATLDSPFPEVVSPLRLAGSWLAPSQNWTSSSYYFGGAFFYLDQQYRGHYLLGRTAASSMTNGKISLTLGDTTYPDYYMSITFTSRASALSPSTPSMLSGKTDYMLDAVTGDSGSPVMVLVNNEPLLVGTWFQPTTAPALWNSNGVAANYLIGVADADAVSKNNLTVATGKVVSVAPAPI